MHVFFSSDMEVYTSISLVFVDKEILCVNKNLKLKSAAMFEASTVLKKSI